MKQTHPINTDADGLAHAMLSSQTKKKDVLHQKGPATGAITIIEYEQKENTN